MSITLDGTETTELRHALLEDLPAVARQFEDVSDEDAGRLRWCLWQELVLLRALGWRGALFEHERELDGACLLGVQQLFRRAIKLLAERVRAEDQQSVRVLAACERVLTPLAIVSTPELERRLARRPFGETNLLRAASTVSRADAEVLRRQLAQTTVGRFPHGGACSKEELERVLEDLRPRGGVEPSSYLLSAPAGVIARVAADTAHGACQRLRFVVSREPNREPLLAALSAVGVCARLCERVVALAEVGGEGERDVA